MGGHSNGFTGSGDIGKYDLTCLSLTSSGLTSDDDRLILLIDDQLLERVFGDHEEMRTGTFGG